MRFSILPTPANSELSIAQVRAAHQAELDAIAHYCRLTSYLAAAQNALDLNVGLYGSLDWAYREMALLNQGMKK